MKLITYKVRDGLAIKMYNNIWEMWSFDPHSRKNNWSSIEKVRDELGVSRLTPPVPFFGNPSTVFRIRSPLFLAHSRSLYRCLRQENPHPCGGG